MARNGQNAVCTETRKNVSQTSTRTCTDISGRPSCIRRNTMQSRSRDDRRSVDWLSCCGATGWGTPLRTARVIAMKPFSLLALGLALLGAPASSYAVSVPLPVDATLNLNVQMQPQFIVNEAGSPDWLDSRSDRVPP